MIAAAMWLLLFTVSLIIEFIKVNLKSLWLGLGALAALLLAFASVPVWVQSSVFVIISCAGAIFLRPLISRKVEERLAASECRELVGRKAVVTCRIHNSDSTGTVSVDGDIWAAKTVSSSDCLEIGTEVEIVRVKDDMLIVTLPEPEETED